jgi:hypothetical protein
MTEMEFQVRKSSLQGKQMSDAAAHVEQAAAWAKTLTQSESRGPGDLENAWRRLESRYGVSTQTFWSLRYRRPKEIASHIYLRLLTAYRAEHDRQMRLLRNELEITKNVAGDFHDSVAAAQAVVDEEN